MSRPSGSLDRAGVDGAFLYPETHSHVRIWEDCVDTGVKSQLGKQVPQRIHTLVLLIPGRDATLAKGVPVAPRTSISRACKPRTGVLSLVHRVWARSVL
jgi:hypothetical protein